MVWHPVVTAMTSELTNVDEPPAATALFQAVLGAVAVLIIALMATSDRGPVAFSAGLLGLWLLAASLISYVRQAHPHSATTMPRRPLVPLRFSGPTGRFALRQRGDGRRVEVIAGPEVVAVLTATDVRDEIVLNADMVPDAELDELGSAIGQAIEMVAVADEDGADRQEPEVARPRGSVTILPPGW